MLLLQPKAEIGKGKRHENEAGITKRQKDFHNSDLKIAHRRAQWRIEKIEAVTGLSLSDNSMSACVFTMNTAGPTSP